MRTTTGGELTLLHSIQRSEAAKIEIINGANTTNVSSRVLSASWNLSADQRVSDGSVVFKDGYTVYATASALNPLVEGSTYNTVAAAYDPLIWPNNDIKIYVGVDTLGSDAADDIKLVFHGVLGDEITPGYAPGDRSLSVHFRDQAKRLQDHFIIGEYVYGDEAGTAAVAVIQGILNDCFTTDTSATAYKKLHVDATAYTNCNLVIYPMKIGNMSCWDAINKVIGCAANDDMGFELRYRYLPDADTSTKDNEGNVITTSGEGFHLCLLQIDQSNTTADDAYSATTDEVASETITISDDTIRNSVYVKYVDRDTKEEMTIHRDDRTSIDTYGLRDMQIGQSDVPFTDTYEEAWDLAGVALNALKDVPGTDRFTVQLGYHVEPNDLLSMVNAQMFTGTDKMGVTDIQFDIKCGGGTETRQGFSMTVTGIRDRITGSRIGFLSMTGESGTQYTLPPAITDGSGASNWGVDTQGNANTKTILTVPVPPNVQYDLIEWMYAVSGEDQWRREITVEPELVIMGLPPGKTLAYLHRFRLKGDER